MLGVGSALTFDHYNTCFVLSDENNSLLVDAGGGNGVLSQLKRAGIAWQDIHQMFITHHHIDHFMGAVWMVRMVGYACQRNCYEGEFSVYGNADVIGLLESICRQLLNPGELEWIGKSIHLVAVHDGQGIELIGHQATVFDIHSPRLVQYGFVIDISSSGQQPGSRYLACCGDEPFHEAAKPYVQGCEWMMHEAFCLHSEREIYKPYNIYHSTVKDACENAANLGVSNLLLYHTEEHTEPNRQALYLEEARRYFSGRIFVPGDLDVIDLDGR